MTLVKAFSYSLIFQTRKYLSFHYLLTLRGVPATRQWSFKRFESLHISIRLSGKPEALQDSIRRTVENWAHLAGSDVPVNISFNRLCRTDRGMKFPGESGSHEPIFVANSSQPSTSRNEICVIFPRSLQPANLRG
jgi:hypothetical protein